MPETAFRVFVDWKLAFLASRDLKHTDRRPLHQYQLSDVEFVDLEQLLSRWLGLLLDRFGLSNLPQLAGFSALFVLFAAEWWRRRRRRVITRALGLDFQKSRYLVLQNL